MSRDIDFLPDDRNPYAPPSTSTRNEPGDRESSELRLFLRWEKLRVLYNAILGVETVLFLIALHPGNRGWTPALIASLAVRCFAANVCYCAGPVLDGYAHWIGFRGRMATGILFGLGTAFAMLLALASISMGGYLFH